MEKKFIGITNATKIGKIGIIKVDDPTDTVTYCFILDNEITEPATANLRYSKIREDFYFIANGFRWFFSEFIWAL